MKAFFEAMKRLNQLWRKDLQEAYAKGLLRRRFLLGEGRPLETMATNTYSGKTFTGLYSYMEGMR